MFLEQLKLRMVQAAVLSLPGECGVSDTQEAEKICYFLIKYRGDEHKIGGVAQLHQH